MFVWRFHIYWDGVNEHYGSFSSYEKAYTAMMKVVATCDEEIINIVERLDKYGNQWFEFEARNKEGSEATYYINKETLDARLG